MYLKETDVERILEADLDRMGSPERAAERAAPEENPESRRLGALAYFMVALSGVVLLFWRFDDRFVRFHSLQAVSATVVFFVVGLLLWSLGSFPFFGFLYSYLYRLYLVLLFLYWLFLMLSAGLGYRYRIPYIGRFVERQMD